MRLLLAAVLSLAASHAPPLIVITPTTPTSLSVAADSAVVVQYLVRNASKRSHALVLQAAPGVMQRLDPATCGAVILLNSGQSCLLILDIDGRRMPEHGVVGGPRLCTRAGAAGTQPDATQCWAPVQSGVLNIHRSARKP